MNLTESDIARFWARVSKRGKDDCWEWSGGKAKGYGMFYVSGSAERAHRVSYVIHFKTIPIGMLVMHECDNPCCVNPNHLKIGTQSNNISDCVKRGRHWSQVCPEKVVARNGEECGQSKLKKVDVIAIRAMKKTGATNQTIANFFGVHRVNIGLILNRKTWGHIK